MDTPGTEAQAVNDRNRQAYDKLAKEYEAKVPSRFRGNLQRIEQFARFIPKGASILDVGCGVGMDVYHFNHRGYRASGVELSPRMAAYARKRNPCAEIINDDFLTHDFGDRTWDAVFARAFLHVFPATIARQVIGRMHDLLKPGGTVLLSVSAGRRPQEGWYEKEDYEDKSKRFKKYWTEAELITALEKHHFEVLHSECLTDPTGKDRIVVIARKD